MKRILVITNNLDQASYRLRIAALIQPLAAHGIELCVQVRPRGLLARRRMLGRADRFDAVILQRKLLDPADARLLGARARRIVYDIDDAVMLPQHPGSGRVARWRAGRRFRGTAAVLDHAVAGNSALAGAFAPFGVPVTILPTVVDPAHYVVKAHAATDIPALVWIGSRSTLPYLREFLPALEQAARRVRGLRLLTIADATLSSGALTIEHIPWSVDVEAAALIRGDIGIAPTPADDWTRGKCGFKIIQYMAAGLPAIASPVGANSQIIIDQETGLLLRSDADWPDAIGRLAADPMLRARLGAAGRARVEQHYSLQRAVKIWLDLLEGPATGRSSP